MVTRIGIAMAAGLGATSVSMLAAHGKNMIVGGC